MRLHPWVRDEARRLLEMYLVRRYSAIEKSTHNMGSRMYIHFVYIWKFVIYEIQTSTKKIPILVRILPMQIAHPWISAAPTRQQSRVAGPV